MDSPVGTHSGRRSFKLLGWAALPVLVLAGIVQISGVGIDILFVAAAGLLLLGLERSVGDWLGEWFGPTAAAIIFVAAAVALSWFFLADSLGRSQTDRFFVEAEQRGYKTVYYQTTSSNASPTTRTAETSTGARPVATGGRTMGRASSAAAAESASDRPDRSEETDGSTSERADSPAESTSANAPEDGAPARRSILSFFRPGDSPDDPIPTDIEVAVLPGRMAPGRRTVITARVRASGPASPSGTVDFSVNGLGAGRVQLNAEGVASTTFRTYLPGQHEVRARYSGSAQHASSRSPAVTLTVTGSESPDRSGPAVRR